jgi:hypothetical protein
MIMKDFDRDTIERMKNAYSVLPVERTDMQATISIARQRLADNTKYGSSKAFFVREQLKSISVFFWLLQLLCFLYMVGNIPDTGGIEQVRALFAVAVPIMTLYMLPELYKAHINRVAEIEAVCAHSSAKVAASKLLILSVSNFAVIALISVICGSYHGLNVLTVLCQGLIPFNIAISISLVFFDFVKLKSPYAMFASAVTISFILVELQNMGSAILAYWTIAFPVSITFLLALVCLTLHRTNRIKEWYYGA